MRFRIYQLEERIAPSGAHFPAGPINISKVDHSTIVILEDGVSPRININHVDHSTIVIEASA
jgi:hypothetical protein